MPRTCLCSACRQERAREAPVYEPPPITIDLPSFDSALRTVDAGYTWVTSSTIYTRLAQELRIETTTDVAEKPDKSIKHRRQIMGESKLETGKTVAKVNVKRVEEGLQVVLFAPDVAKFIQKRLATESYTENARLGGVSVKAYAIAQTSEKALQKVCCSMLGDKAQTAYGANLSCLRLLDATSKEVTWVYPGLYSREAAREYLEQVTDFLRNFYSQYISPFDKTMTIRLEDETARQPVKIVSQEISDLPTAEVAV